MLWKETKWAWVETGGYVYVTEAAAPTSTKASIWRDGRCVGFAYGVPVPRGGAVPVAFEWPSNGEPFASVTAIEPSRPEALWAWCVQKNGQHGGTARTAEEAKQAVADVLWPPAPPAPPAQTPLDRLEAAVDAFLGTGKSEDAKAIATPLLECLTAIDVAFKGPEATAVWAVLWAMQQYNHVLPKTFYARLTLAIVRALLSIAPTTTPQGAQ